SKSSYPEYPWLGRDINRQWLQMLPKSELPWDHLLVLSRYPEPDKNPFIQLLLQYERFLEKLDSLPKTLSHGDTYPTNFMSRIDPKGREQTVALDWALLGLQALGYDLGQFVFGAINNLSDIQKEEITENLFGSYIHGLRDEGCALDAELVRVSFMVSAALRVGLFQLYILDLEIKQGGVEIVPDDSSYAPDPFEVVMAREAFRLLEA
ncbi:MAG: phosphotransferase, partial [Anaerolineales bacterium]|nr:phosphotransferase [Anaerolineales bacterium]